MTITEAVEETNAETNQGDGRRVPDWCWAVGFFAVMLALVLVTGAGE